MAPFVFRFAPSPNGLLHLGHAYSALLNHDLARAHGGVLLLRVEDIDPARSRPEFEHQIYEDLAWLGIHWAEPVWRQSQRMPVYTEILEGLEARGLAYPCFATRSEIRAAVGTDAACDPDGAPLYPGLWRDAPRVEVMRRRAEGERPAYRLDLARALDAAGLARESSVSWREWGEDGIIREATGRPANWGDVVLARKEVPTSYHLSVVVDDAAQQVTHVVRGRDLHPATPLHRLLQILLGLSAPLYRHHRLITDKEGRKLSKSAGDRSLATLREAGWLPSDVRRAVGLEA